MLSLGGKLPDPGALALALTLALTLTFGLEVLIVLQRRPDTSCSSPA